MTPERAIGEASLNCVCVVNKCAAYDRCPRLGNAGDVPEPDGGRGSESMNRSESISPIEMLDAPESDGHGPAAGAPAGAPRACRDSYPGRAGPGRAPRERSGGLVYAQVAWARRDVTSWLSAPAPAGPGPSRPGSLAARAGGGPGGRPRCALPGESGGSVPGHAGESRRPRARNRRATSLRASGQWPGGSPWHVGGLGYPGVRAPASPSR